MYEQGDGVERDLRLARYWYDVAARNGDEAAPGVLEALRFVEPKFPRHLLIGLHGGRLGHHRYFYSLWISRFCRYFSFLYFFFYFFLFRGRFRIFYHHFLGYFSRFGGNFFFSFYFRFFYFFNSFHHICWHRFFLDGGSGFGGCLFRCFDNRRS